MLWLIALLVSCSVSLSNEEQRKRLRPPASGQSSLQQQKKAMAAISKTGWPKDAWWLHFHCRELNQLIASGLKANPSLNIFRAKIQQSQANTMMKRALRAPYVWFHTQTNEQQRSQNGIYRALNPRIRLDAHEVDFNVNFRYEFDFWGKNTNLLHAAIGEEKTAEAELASVRLMTTTAIANSYFLFSSLQLKTSLLKKLLRVETALLKLQNKLLDKGLLAKIPVLATRQKQQYLREQLAQTKQLAINARHLTNVVAGRDPDKPLKGMTLQSKLPLKLRLPDKLAWDFIARRPDLMAKIWLAKALAFKTGAAMAEYYPNIDLIGLVGLESVTWDKLLRISSGTALLRPAIHLPVFTAGSIQANINKQKAAFTEAIFAYNEQLLQASQEVLDNLAIMVKTNQVQHFQRLAVQAASQRYQLSKLRNDKGLDSDLITLEAEQAYLLEKLAQVTTTSDQYVASVNLIKSLGGGYHTCTLPEGLYSGKPQAYQAAHRRISAKGNKH